MGVAVLALARFTLKGPYQAAAVVGLLAVLETLVPLLLPTAVISVFVAALCMVLSCALVGLIILTQGSISGLKVIGVSILGITLVAGVLFQQPELGLWTGLVQWLPIILLAQALRSSNSLTLMIWAGLLIGVVAIAAQQIFWSDLEADWIALATQQMAETKELNPALADNYFDLVRLFAASLVAMAFMMFSLIVLWARWMQSRLVESNGFAHEFQALSLGRSVAAVAVIVTALSLLLSQAWLGSLVFLLVIAFMFQGIAVIHSKLAIRRQSRLLLGLFYALLLIFPQIVVVTAVTGVIDNWIAFRKTKPES